MLIEIPFRINAPESRIELHKYIQIFFGKDDISVSIKTIHKSIKTMSNQNSTILKEEVEKIGYIDKSIIKDFISTFK